MPDLLSLSRSKTKTSTAVQAAKRASGNAKPEGSPPILRHPTQHQKPETLVELFPMPSAPPGFAVAEATFAVLAPTSVEPQTGVNPSGVAAIQLFV